MGEAAAMADVAALVKEYVDRYNSSDVDGMLACCTEDVVYEAVHDAGSVRLSGKQEVREVLLATLRAFLERRKEVVGLIVDGRKAAAETVFSGVAAAKLSPDVGPGDPISTRGAVIFELKGDRFARISDYG
jgi:ketosteroid isomerase-like protein